MQSRPFGNLDPAHLQPSHLFKILCELPPGDVIPFVHYFMQTDTHQEMYRLCRAYAEKNNWALSPEVNSEAEACVKKPFMLFVFALTTRNVRYLQGPLLELLQLSIKYAEENLDNPYKKMVSRIKISLTGVPSFATKKNWDAIAQLIKHESEGYVNLQNADWADCDLPGVHLKNSQLDELWAISGKLSYANFSGSTLHKSAFDKGILTYTIFDNATLTEASLTRCRLQSSSWNNANALRVKLEGSDLSNAEGKKADFTRASLPNCTLFDAQFTDSTFCHVSFVNVKAIGAKFIRCDFYHANFINANFNQTNLSGCYLAYPSLEGSSFLNAKLDGALFFYRRDEKVNVKPTVLIHAVLDHFFRELTHHAQADAFKQAMVNDLIRLARECDHEETRSQVLQAGIAHPIFKHPQIRSKLREFTHLFSKPPETMYVTMLKAALETEVQRVTEESRPW